ncbi:Si-specific NAD(P)(+) transhydrogenase [Chondromyces crocatus]|uniref:Soluble pyridine nucleotide transhydrogenase n=1 Tax=Chondromyces crocatus TaxID=52 RepID=A0A0K1EEC6_CHOCO|nr:Si-specific NAD(P)(+) transhydrogenase [Chondromyces crocatus]AKT39042.1 soluble pyridine nucleotide transhydrogenase [Chondromyces crocatus]
MSIRPFDVVVIGTGPGGEGAAMKCTKANLRVCVIEDRSAVGGACTHTATIPSKTLRHAIQRLVDLRNLPGHRAAAGHGPTFRELVQTAGSVTNRQAGMREGFYERNRVEVVEGRARFVDAHTVEVIQPRGATDTLTAKHFVIATGSRPYHPPEIDFNHPRVFDSDTILGMIEMPQSMTIYGAGVIGCEYASMFRMLGVKVNLVNTREKLLSFLDDEIIDALSYHLRDLGCIIRHNEEIERVETADDGVILDLKSGKRLKTDVLLWANGRSGNTVDMGLEALGIAIDSRGNLKVNDAYQTAVPHIHAVGDVVGFPSLASAAYDQGRFAGTQIVEGRLEHRLVQDIPTGIYTSPEISSLGRNERELTAAGVPYEVGQAQFKSLARAQITGRTVGMLKILFHRDTLELLGIHCFGDNAAEIIHIGQAIMSQKGEANTLLYFVNTTFNYPTMAEAYRVAALNGLNRVF